MQCKATDLPGVLLLQPKVHRDTRGWFKEYFRQDVLAELLPGAKPFVQDNLSCSAKGVLRGLHWQRAPHAQAKLVQLVRGATYTVVADVRPTSATFCRWTGMTLHARQHQLLWIPEGFAHGFLALADHTCVLYKTTAYYSPEHAMAVSWRSPRLNIQWPQLDVPIVLSEQDRCAPDTVPVCAGY